ncbi:flagellin [Onishia taeanensis]|uniref:Flagellin n=1 Tax=Onishia taeanensis TaxID=284577 RepID=A0A328Y320_9GAMM|nr:FliC/FljB family flagellin [Halomonas taeanensis]RAR64591.1 flagellin [Halomonas taeanensis]
MSMGINTNITSMIGQQNLNESKSALTTSMERLSSGLRINSAKDDAAGQAIANRMSSQITGLSQAQRNANDGISVAQTAEGALNQVNDNLQRVRELTVQAQNGTNSSEDLTSIQDEINQRLNEIDRISEQTDFNGTKVLSETRDLNIQVGANDSEQIAVSLEKIDKASLSLGGFTVEENAVRAGDAIATIDDGSGTNEVAVDLSQAASDLSGALGASVLESDLTLRQTQDASGNPEAGSYVIEFQGESYAAYQNNTTTGDNENEFGVAVVDDGSGSNDVAVKVGVNDADATVGYVQNSDGDLVEVTDAFADDGGNDNFASVAADITTGETAFNGAATADPLAALDSALSTVDSLRSDLGAVQNRFESAITNLQTNETNLSAARSRIEDADYATEVADMTKNQILQQAGTSVLAQANQLPQSVLSLLG